MNLGLERRMGTAESLWGMGISGGLGVQSRWGISRGHEQVLGVSRGCVGEGGVGVLGGVPGEGERSQGCRAGEGLWGVCGD